MKTFVIVALIVALAACLVAWAWSKRQPPPSDPTDHDQQIKSAP